MQQCACLRRAFTQAHQVLQTAYRWTALMTRSGASRATTPCRSRIHRLGSAVMRLAAVLRMSFVATREVSFVRRHFHRCAACIHRRRQRRLNAIRCSGPLAGRRSTEAGPQFPPAYATVWHPTGPWRHRFHVRGHQNRLMHPRKPHQDRPNGRFLVELNQTQFEVELPRL